VFLYNQLHLHLFKKTMKLVKQKLTWQNLMTTLSMI